MTGTIKISYAGRDVVEKDFSVLTSRSVKTVFAQFTFDSEWNEFETKTAIFVNGDIVKSQIVDSDNSCEVPWEVLATAGTLTVGVVGQSGDKIYPSVKAEGVLLEGIYTEGAAPEEPTPDVYQQIVQLMQDTQQIAKSVRNDADAGKFNGKNGADYVLTPADESEIAKMAAAAVSAEMRKTVYILPNGYCYDINTKIEYPISNILSQNFYTDIPKYKFVYFDIVYDDIGDGYIPYTIDLDAGTTGVGDILSLRGKDEFTGFTIYGSYENGDAVQFSFYQNVASKSNYGEVKIGDGLIATNGVVSVDKEALLGDVESALDEIIALEEAYIGGDSE